MRWRIALTLLALIAAASIVLAPTAARAQSGTRLEPTSYEPITCGPSCTTLRIYYNQAPPPGEAFGLVNWVACCAGWSGSAGAANVHDTYADYTWGYPYNQGTHMVVLADGDIVSSPFVIDFSITQPTPIETPDSPEMSGYQLMPCGTNCGTVRIYYDVVPPPGGWGLGNWQHFMTWSGAAGPTNVHDTYADFTFGSPYVPASAVQYVLGSGDIFSSPFTVDWSGYVPGAPGTPPIGSVALGDHSATITWVKPASGGNTILGYTVTAAPGGRTCSTDSADALTCTISGLTNGVNYTFTVTARNIVGSSPPPGPGLGSGPGTPTGAGTPGTPPAPVTGVQPLPDPTDGTQVTLTWLAAASELPIVGYRATAAPGGQFCATDGALSCTITGLTIGQNYTFTVVAINGVGPSDPSDPVGIAPSVASVSPNSGPANGGTIVTIRGNHLSAVTAITFGATFGTDVTVIDDTTLLATTPPGSGTVDVHVTSPGGSSPSSTGSRYTFYPTSDVATSLAASTAAAGLGDVVTQNVIVTNNGPNQATGVTATLQFAGPDAALLTVGTTIGTCSVASRTITCAIGTLTSGAAATIVVSVEPDATGTLNATASSTANEADPISINNAASISIGITNTHGCTIIGTGAADSLTGTSGDDVICALGGNDQVSGGAGNDVIYGGSGNDVLDGGNGNDIIYAGSNGSSLFGGNGNDTIYGGIGDDTIYGNNGDDTISAGDGNDTIYGGNGNDTLDAGTGTDTADGGNGNDTCSHAEATTSCTPS